MNHFNPWSDLGSSLFDANREWNTELLPDLIAVVAEQVSMAYARDPSRDFEQTIEEYLSIELPDITNDEMHAGKYVIGKIFAANRADKKLSKRVREAELHDHLDRIEE